MRLAKYTLLVFGLLLTMVGCGEKKKEIPSAAERMQKHKEVYIITDARNAPFETGSGTGAQGMDIDIGNEMAKDLGLPAKWLITKGYDHSFELLGNGEGEILISAVAIDPAKSAQFDFSKPYYDTGDVIAYQRSNMNIKDLASLSGKKVGVATGRPADAFMAKQKTATNVTISKYPTLDDALGALNRGEIDAVVGDEAIISYSSVHSYVSTATLPVMVNKYQYAAVVRKGETELLAKINATIDRLNSSGELKKLDETYIDPVLKEAEKLRQGDVKDYELKKSPKSISVSIQKISGAFSMDRLDGFVLVLEGPSVKYQSTPILTDGNKGNCRFTQPVPPGDYRLAMSIFKMVTKVTVPDLPKNTLAMDMKVASGGISITMR